MITQPASDDSAPDAEPPPIGRLSFFETIRWLDTEPANLGLTAPIVFFSNRDRFRYRRPDSLVDHESGVVCCPTNYEGEIDHDPCLRVSQMANHPAWTALDREAYRAAKEEALDRAAESVLDFAPDIRPHTIATDCYSPLTITRYTSRHAGAVYGSPDKRGDGRTPWPDLYLCGTDQGFLGIIGSILSGVTMANAHVVYRRD